MEGNYLLLFIITYPMVGALVSYIIGRKNKIMRDYFAQFICASEFIVFMIVLINYETFNGTSFTWNNFSGLGLHFTFDGFRIIHGVLASFLWLSTTFMAREYFKGEKNRNRYYMFTLLTLGATMGVFLSSDLFTLFIFFEMMSFTSYVWVAQDEKKKSLRAAETYLSIAIIGGLVMLMGLFLLYNAIGTLDMASLLVKCRDYSNKPILYIVASCFLFGFGAKAGIFLLHVWMPKTYTYAPAPASALLSGILSKTGIYGILIVSGSIFYQDATWGTIIIVSGLFTMVGGALMALCSSNLKRTLAFSSMSQIGFILVGVGMLGILGQENTIAARGALLHMVNHSLIKLILFMVAGIIFMNIKKLELNEIQGYGRNKTILKVVFLSAALSISGIPLFSGYISKTLIHESIIKAIHLGVFEGNFLQIVEYLFLISGGFTVAYMAKLFIAIFIERNSDIDIQRDFDSMKKGYMSKVTAIMLSITAFMLPVLGCVTTSITDKIADMGQGIMNVETMDERVEYFNITNLKGGIVTILIGIIIYAGFVRIWMMKKDQSGSMRYFECWPKWINLEEYIYRPIVLILLPFLGGIICRICDSLVDGMVVLLRKTIYKDLKLVTELEEGTKITLMMGSIINRFVGILNKTIRRKNPLQQNYTHRLAVSYNILVENNLVIARSLSFGLLLFCIGFVITLLYLLW